MIGHLVKRQEAFRQGEPVAMPASHPAPQPDDARAPIQRYGFSGRIKRSARVIDGYKRQVRACEVCGWKEPGWGCTLVHAHHVIPMACGGLDDASNLCALCPNHHALAHAVSLMSRTRGYQGPRTKDALISAIRYFEKTGRRLTLSTARELIESLRA